MIQSQTLWNFQDFSGTKILREINFEEPKSSKTALFAVSEALKFDFGKCQPSRIAKNSSKSIFAASKILE